MLTFKFSGLFFSERFLGKSVPLMCGGNGVTSPKIANSQGLNDSGIVVVILVPASWAFVALGRFSAPITEECARVRVGVPVGV